MKGKFIVIDGGEGAGKGTVLEALKKEPFLSTAVFTREPGGTPLAEKIRAEMLLSDVGKEMSPLTQFNLFWAARSDHIDKRVRPALLEGRHVISDRFDSSTFAYQIRAQGHGELQRLFWEMRKEHLQYIPQPFYIYLDVDPLEGLRRVKGREESNHFDQRDLEFHTRVREGFLEFLDAASGFRAPLDVHATGAHFFRRIVDANCPTEEVVQKALELVKSILEE